MGISKQTGQGLILDCRAYLSGPPRETVGLAGEFGIGQPVRRFEDKRFLSGNGHFQSDNNLHGQAYACVLRSPHAHARIRKLDIVSAQAAPGVALIMTGNDLAEARLGVMGVPFQRKRPDGSPMFARAFRGLSQGRVRYVGEPVVFVVAETLAQAKDAAELIAIDYEALPSVTDTAEAAEGKVAVWDECPDNISNVFETGNKTATDAAFAKAAHIVTRRYVISRVYAHFMEPRGAIGVWDPGEDHFTLYADVQYPHRHCQLSGPRAPFFGPARLERGITIGEQKTFRPEPPRHRHNKHTTGG